MARTVVTYDAGTWDVAGVAPSSSPVTVTDAALSTSDITTNNVTTAKHGFTPKLPNDATKYLDGTGAYTVPAGTSAVSSVFGRTGAVVAATNDYTEAQLSFSDITTNNASTSKHGFAPKYPNDATKFLDGTGAYSVPGGTAAAGSTVLVYRYTVVGSDKASIDTGVDTPDAGTNVWTNGDLLEIMLLLRTDEAVVQSRVNMTFNNDATSIYDTSFVRNLNATVSGNNSIGIAGVNLQAAGASASANYFAAMRGSIPLYNQTVAYKSGEISTGSPDSTAANSVIWLQSFAYRSTTALSRLALAPNTAAKKLKVGSSLLIYKRTSS